MLPLIGLIAVFICGLLYAGAAAGKLYHQRRSKKKKKKGKKLKNQQPSPSQELEEDLELGQETNLTEYTKLEKSVAVAEVEEEEEEEDVVAELMKAHNLSGPARFLSTIEEETSADLASEDGKQGRRARMSLMDLMRESDENFMCPIASPVNKSTRALTGSVRDGIGLVNGWVDSSMSFRNMEVAAARG